jgi:hypothetical protein
MSRTKGAKDRNPRKMSPNSMAHLHNKSLPGYASETVRVHGPAGDVKWFLQMEPLERGKVVSKGRKDAE